METWLVDNWWWFVPGILGAAYLAFQVRRRGGTEPLHRRVAYIINPLFDPQNEQRRRINPRVVAAYEAAVAVTLVGGVGYLIWSLL
jgi:hypothetical protein